MNAKKQIMISITVGSNNDNVTKEMMLAKVFELEVQFNASNPNMRMHASEINVGIKNEQCIVHPDLPKIGESYTDERGEFIPKNLY